MSPTHTTVIRRDRWITGIGVLGAMLLAAALVAYEVLERWARRADVRDLDALVVVVLILNLAFAIHAWRRWRQLLAELAQQQQRETSYQLLFEANPQPAWVYDLESLAILAVNDAAIAQYGYTRAEFLMLTLRDLRPVEDVPRLLDSVQTSPRSLERSGPWQHQTKDGTARWVEIASCPLTYHSRSARLVVANDVTARIEEHRRVAVAEARYRMLAEQLPAMVAFIDPLPGQSGDWYVSPQIEPILGYTPAEFSSTPDFWIELLHPDDHARIVEELAVTDATGEQFDAEFRLQHRDGDRYVWFQSHSVLVRDEAGIPQYWQGMMLDVTVRKQAEAAVREAETRYRTLVEQLPAVTYISEPDDLSNVSYISPQVEALIGYAPAEIMHLPGFWYRCIHPDDYARVVALDDASLVSRELHAEYRLIAADGRIVWIQDEAVLVRRGAADPGYWQGVMVDITDRKLAEAAVQQSEQRFRHQALHDPLTDLPNRALFEDRLGHALRGATRRAGKLAVVFLDLDNFKVINDSLGHKAGDQLLQVVARRLSAAVRTADTVARLGGDEFTILLEDVTDAGDAIAIVERMVTHLSVPIDLAGHQITVHASLGIALADDPQLTAEELIRRADVAMYAAKRNGKGRHALFDTAMQHAAWMRLAIEVDLRQALTRGELEVYYQPVVDLEYGSIREVEALMRWRHPHRGLVPPMEFLPIAAEIGLLVTLERWLLDEACRQVRAWQQTYPSFADLTVSVNVSPHWLREPSLAEDVALTLASVDLAPQHLKLEITEQAMLADLEGARVALRRLHQLGTRLAIDDFGTGNAALTFLREVPVETLKIDRSFVFRMAQSEVDTALVRALVTLAKTLGLVVTAEGIESTQTTALREFGCDLGQGFAFARPLPAADLATLLATGTCFPVGSGPQPSSDEGPTPSWHAA